MKLRNPAVLFAVMAMVACADQSATPTSPLAASENGWDAIAPPDELVRTPAGWYHRSCVHEVPSGARVDRNGLVTLTDGTTYQLPKCLYPGRRDANGVRIASGGPGPQ